MTIAGAAHRPSSGRGAVAGGRNSVVQGYHVRTFICGIEAVTIAAAQVKLWEHGLL